MSKVLQLCEGYFCVSYREGADYFVYCYAHEGVYFRHAFSLEWVKFAWNEGLLAKRGRLGEDHLVLLGRLYELVSREYPGIWEGVSLRGAQEFCDVRMALPNYG